MNTVIVRFPNHPIDNKSVFVFEAIAVAMVMIEDEVELLRHWNVNPVQVEISFGKLEQSEFDALPGFEGW